MAKRSFRNFRFYRLFRSLIYVKPKMDALNFIENYDKLWGKIADPSPTEVVERLKFLKLNRVMEIGSGNGRIAIPLALSGFEVTCVEPEELLALETIDKGIDTLVSRIQDLNLIEGKIGGKFDCVISVRVVSYLSLFDTIKMLRFLGGLSDIFIGWEEYVGSRRLRIARFFVRKIKVVVVETSF